MSMTSDHAGEVAAVDDVLDDWSQGVPPACMRGLRRTWVVEATRRGGSHRDTHIRDWNEFDRGGHLAAVGQPRLRVDEVRRSFRSVR